MNFFRRCARPIENKLIRSAQFERNSNERFHSTFIYLLFVWRGTQRPRRQLKQVRTAFSLAREHVMSAHRRARHLCSIALFAGILTVPVVPAFAQVLAFNDQPGFPQYAGQVLAFGPMQNYQSNLRQYAPQTEPQTQSQGDSVASDRLSPELRRQVVAYQTAEQPGTVIIDTAHKFLYLTMGGGKAMRYGIGVGRQGFTWSGVQTISRKAEWPDWIPPTEMVARQPYLPRWVGGGPGNPLGARAMYLGNTEYRIHGTNDPTTIGKNVSSGCIRLENSEVEDLYQRVGLGTKVIVLPNDSHASAERVSANDGVTIDRAYGGRMTARISVAPLADAKASHIAAR
jgi:lipoprotein-anchoring transpeptidase ErfK/SrfK